MNKLKQITWFSGLIIILIFETLNSRADASALIRNIDFEDAQVINVIQVLARSSEIDLVLSGDPGALQNKKATIHLKNTTAEEAIDYLLQTNGFTCEKRGKTLLISSLPGDLAQTAYQPGVEVVTLKYIGASTAAALLMKAFPQAGFQSGERTDTLLVRSKKNELAEIKKIIKELDRPVPQVLIESKVLELAQSDSKKLGLSYGNGTYRFIASKNDGKIRPADDLLISLNALITEGKANILANPRIATLDNKEAIINIGDRIPYAVPVTGGSFTTQWTINYIDAGVKLKITPQLGEEGEITTLIVPEVSSISEWKITAAGEFPVISTRNAAATIRVKNGETIIIGGLLLETERQNISRVPILGYLPGVGILFQNKNSERGKTEIVFLITPHLI